MEDPNKLSWHPHAPKEMGQSTTRGSVEGLQRLGRGCPLDHVEARIVLGIRAPPVLSLALPRTGNKHSRTQPALLECPGLTSVVPAPGLPPIHKKTQSNPRINPCACCSQVASTDAGSMGIPYRGLGLITLVGTTHDTSLL